MIRWFLQHSGRKMINEFAKKFPGRCVICAYHRYGVLHGFIAARTTPPAHHGCPESTPERPAR